MVQLGQSTCHAISGPLSAVRVSGRDALHTVGVDGVWRSGDGWCLEAWMVCRGLTDGLAFWSEHSVFIGVS